LPVVSFLKDEGIKEGDRVAIYGNNNIDFVINVLALWQISAVPVPINTRLTENEISEQINLTQCGFILVSDELKNEFKNTSIKQIKYPFEQNIKLTQPSRLNLDAEDTAAIIFTSGSSSKPKGVELSFNSFYQSAVIGNQLLRHMNSDRWLASLPFYHVGGFSIITRALLFSVPIIIPDSISADELISSIEKFHPTLISLVSTQLKRIVERKIKPNPEMKICLLGGGFSNNELIEEAINLGWPIVKVYGSTETSSFITALLTEEFNFKPNSSGKPLPPNTISIQDENGNELKPFEVGEVVVITPALMKGYAGSSTKPVEEYRTGDIGFIDDEGYLFIETRRNDLIVSGGENINTVEVENTILIHTDVIEVCVVGIENKEWGQIVSAAVVLKEKSILTENELKNFLKDKLASFKIPKQIIFVNQLPKSQLGKILREKVKELF
jgi:O-succinylbenzoic acid--CoA ligase